MNTEHLQAQMCKCKRQPDNDGIMQGIQTTGGREQNVIHEKQSDLDSIVVDISAQVYLPTQGFIILTHVIIAILVMCMVDTYIYTLQCTLFLLYIP